MHELIIWPSKTIHSNVQRTKFRRRVSVSALESQGGRRTQRKHIPLATTTIVAGSSSLHDAAKSWALALKGLDLDRPMPAAHLVEWRRRTAGDAGSSSGVDSMHHRCRVQPVPTGKGNGGVCRMRTGCGLQSTVGTLRTRFYKPQGDMNFTA